MSDAAPYVIPDEPRTIDPILSDRVVLFPEDTEDNTPEVNTLEQVRDLLRQSLNATASVYATRRAYARDTLVRYDDTLYLTVTTVLSTNTTAPDTNDSFLQVGSSGELEVRYGDDPDSTDDDDWFDSPSEHFDRDLNDTYARLRIGDGDWAVVQLNDPRSAILFVWEEDKYSHAGRMYVDNADIYYCEIFDNGTDGSPSSGNSKFVKLTRTGGGGSDIAVQDDGTEIQSAATQINFTGDGVTVTADGTGVEVAIVNAGASIETYADSTAYSVDALVTHTADSIRRLYQVTTAVTDSNTTDPPDNSSFTLLGFSEDEINTLIEDNAPAVEQRAETLSFQASATLDQSGAVISKNTTTPLGVVYPVGATDNEIIALGTNADGFTILLAGIYDIAVDCIVNPSGERVTSTFEIYEYADTVGTDAPIGQTDSVYLRYDDTDIGLHEHGELIVGANNTAVKLVARNAFAGGASGATGNTFDLTANAVLRSSSQRSTGATRNTGH